MWPEPCKKGDWRLLEPKPETNLRFDKVSKEAIGHTTSKRYVICANRKPLCHGVTWGWEHRLIVVACNVFPSCLDGQSVGMQKLEQQLDELFMHVRCAALYCLCSAQQCRNNAMFSTCLAHVELFGSWHVSQHPKNIFY